MGLSRLDNFLKSIRGTILYVDPNSLDSTDSIENQGNSLTRPFKTIQRALIEAARFSYQSGLNNDRFGNTTILLYPGDHIVDNRPGWGINSSGEYILRNGRSNTTFPELNFESNFNLNDTNNDLYRFNSFYGGVIVPRGTSIVGLDLRKTKVKPLYVPDPLNDNIERSAIFRVTGSCYFWQFSIFDADPTGSCYIDYNTSKYFPNFSHHKLTCFEYADGINKVVINDDFINYNSNYSDLDLYYQKIALGYGKSSGREISPDSPFNLVDIQKKIDEYRIVGSDGETANITNIKSGNGSIATEIITVTLDKFIEGLEVNTSFRINGVSDPAYNGRYIVSKKINNTTIEYKVQNIPQDASPSFTGGKFIIASDTIDSSSPYIFNVSLRSVYGMCGLLADGKKATGFKSMLTAQFTGISLQKDDKAFVLYDSLSGTYRDSLTTGNENISTNTRSYFKPQYNNYHIKTINDAFVQAVSVFSIGFSEQFITESGGDMSITNSSSNFGSRGLCSYGFKDESFEQDSQGYITHVITPKELGNDEINVRFYPIDVQKTKDEGLIGKLFLYKQSDNKILPSDKIDGYKIGAKKNDFIYVQMSSSGVLSEFSAKIVMPNSNFSGEKVSYVYRTVSGLNNISNNILTLTENHQFLTGESVRIISDDGDMPDGIEKDRLYYVILTVNGDKIKLASSLEDAQNSKNINLNNMGGSLKIVSSVLDKKCGDIGHPIQYSTSQNNWYITVSTNTTENNLYSKINSSGTSVLGSSTPKTYIKRIRNDRTNEDSTYRMRYFIPSSSLFARPPLESYVIQESNDTIGTNSEITSYSNTGSISNFNDIKNFRIISNASWSNKYATITTEYPHDLTVDCEIEISNILSTNNTTGVYGEGYNGRYVVTEILNQLQFKVYLENNPGNYTNDGSNRSIELPYFKKKTYKNTYRIFRTTEIQRHIPNQQDGIYDLSLVLSSISPKITPFQAEKFSQPIENFYPLLDNDNLESDPSPSTSFAVKDNIGKVILNDNKKSLTKECVNNLLVDFNHAKSLANIRKISPEVYELTTKIDHGFNRIISLTISSAGNGYGEGTVKTFYNVPLVKKSTYTSSVGKNATARVKVDSSGKVIEVKIMNGGSAYSVGNKLTITGLPTGTLSGFSECTLTVSSIYSNVGDVLKLDGVYPDYDENYNTLYEITDIYTGIENKFRVKSPTITTQNITQVSDIKSDKSYYYITGESITISSISYNTNTNICSVTLNANHNFKENSKVRIVSNSIFFDGIIIDKSLNSFNMNILGPASKTSVESCTKVYPHGITSNAGIFSSNYIGGRSYALYDNIETKITSAISTTTSDSINIDSIDTLDIKIGDFLQINEEIVRVKQSLAALPSNPIKVFRGVLGTKASTHANGSAVKRISVKPVELRRNSTIRSSGHTFEYVGYGPGNYSTALPKNQDRILSDDQELISQSLKSNGGIVVYTGMNSDGDFYTGNKKINFSTGKQESYDFPIPLMAGEDVKSNNNILEAEKVFIDSYLNVHGDQDIPSQFNGPVKFESKITANSEVDVKELNIKGDQKTPINITISDTKPTDSGTYGDIVLYSMPEENGNIGWVYTVDNKWEPFGPISQDIIDDNGNIITTNKVGVGTTTISSSSKLEVSGGNISISGGNLKVQSGYGIDFSSTSDSSGKTSELLDDYEEGTFSFSVQDGSNTGTNGSGTGGSYVKIGGLVYFSMKLSNVNTNNFSTGNVIIYGLPFTSASSPSSNVGSVVFGYAAGFSITAGRSITGSINPGTSTINLRVWDSSGGTSSMTYSEAKGTLNAHISGFYRAS